MHDFTHMGKTKDTELAKIVAFMRKTGILKYRNSEFEICLSRQALKLPKPRVKKVAASEGMQAPLAPNSLDMLLWSSTPQS